MIELIIFITFTAPAPAPSEPATPAKSKNIVSQFFSEVQQVYTTTKWTIKANIY